MAIEPAPAAPPPPAPAPEPQVRVITLNDGEHNDSTLYRFEKGTILQFCPGPSLLGRKVFLYTNYVFSDDSEAGDEPPSETAEFVRAAYRALSWRRLAGARAGAPLPAPAPLDSADRVCELRLARAGPFHYYFVYDDAGSKAGARGSGWFQVEPTLSAGGVPVPLDAVSCHTVLAKCLGPLPRWLSVLRVSKEAGYNAVHFTPVQALGGSNSAYSLRDQLRLDERYGADGRAPSLADLDNVLAHLRNEWKMLCISDVVLNHTANETPWLAEHPEASYNTSNCPHLRPAALLDAALAALSARTPSPAVSTPEDVEALRGELTQAAESLRLHECYQCDPPALARAFTAAAGRRPPPPAAPPHCARLRLLPDPQRRRLASTVDMDRALQLYNVRAEDECGAEEARLQACAGRLTRALEELNAAAADTVAAHLRAAVDNCLAGIRYERVAADGPRLREVSARCPLVPQYFRWPPGALSLSPAQLEQLVYGLGGCVCAHNGWVMNADPLEDFAAPEADGRVYLRRELLAWGDSVKLRYGRGPDDCPFLWRHMRQYVETTAELFDGLRLDNCHSTPLHVAEYLLDCARNVKPELYVVAELFTNSDHVDNIYVNRLGITCLIREAQSAWDSHEQGRLVHRFGGRPVGAFLSPPRRPAAPATARALLLDLTHDNPSPLTTRSVYDTTATAAVVAAACCASGSTRGLDELVPHHVHVVDETRVYAAWGEGAGAVGGGAGLMHARRLLNELHAELADYREVFVDQLDADTVAITRHRPEDRHSVIVVVRNAFRAPLPGAPPPPPPRPLRVEGELADVALEIEIQPRPGYEDEVSRFVRPADVIGGLQGWQVSVRRPGTAAESALLAGAGAEGEGGVTELRWARLPPGAVLVLRLRPPAPAAAALARLHAAPLPADVLPALRALDLADLNELLYRCEAEERAATGSGAGVYDVPGRGPLPYAGLRGAAAALEAAAAADDLAAPVCHNLRAGDWLPDYTLARLERSARLRALAAPARAGLAPLRALPRYLRPAYFHLAHGALLAAAQEAALAQLAAPGDDEFSRALALTAVQMLGRVADAPLPLPPAPPAPPPSLSAGLPHFAAGYMRCWGRDTFVALPGLLLATGRWAEARDHILGFAATLRHGLIPNLLDGGKRARYNCRDAVWWWLYAIRRYCELAPDGARLLGEPVARLFPTDDSEALDPASAPRVPLHSLVQEALEAHFQGRVFRERGAGPHIDAHMREPGFTVQVGVAPDTGFVFGGNDHNAGTWMDKMGSSERAGTRGVPATPRDGAAVELQGLAYAAVSWLAALHAGGAYPHAGVTRRAADGGTTRWRWAQWAELLRRSFERHYWVPGQPSAADARPDLVHRRHIYKDTLGATRPWADYQLRCNYVIAMAVAPELFDPKHARLALEMVETQLATPLGLRTLDPADWAYRAAYDPGDDSADPASAHGYSYHQGPAWLWPLGFYLRARLRFQPSARPAVLAALGPLHRPLLAADWRGLPELTQADGSHCPHGCQSQAWSSGVVLEVLSELRAA